jgi:hypothetical protein
MRWIVLAIALIVAALLLDGCKDQYRYHCQNPDNFYAKECQKPKCLFTQQCPEYLVAPILEKAANAQPAASEASSNR